LSCNSGDTQQDIAAEAITFLDLLRFLPFPHQQSVPELCLQVLQAIIRILRHRKENPCKTGA
jgi:hypothetical protein